MGHLVVPYALMGLDRVHTLGDHILHRCFCLGALLCDSQRLGDMPLRNDHHAVVVSHHQVSTTHRATGELYLDAVPGEGATIANRLLNDPLAIGGKALLLHLIDIPCHPIDDHAHQTILHRRKRGDATETIDVHQPIVIDD